MHTFVVFLAIIGAITCAVFLILLVALVFVAYATRGDDEPDESALL